MEPGRRGRPTGSVRVGAVRYRAGRQGCLRALHFGVGQPADGTAGRRDQRGAEIHRSDSELRPRLLYARCSACLFRSVRAASDPFQRAMRLSPRDPLTFFFENYLALAHYHQGRYEDAAKMARMGIAIRPTHVLYRTLAACYGRLGRLEEA